MRSRKDSIVSATEVHHWALQWLLDARLLKDHGPQCTAVVVWNVVLRAAARMMSVFAACRDLANAPSQQAVFDALEDGLPRTLPVLEKRLNGALIGAIPRRMRRHAWEMAIDWHLVPYYGEPQHSRNEIYYGNDNAASRALINPSILADETLYPTPAIEARLFRAEEASAATERIRTRTWTRVKTAK